MLNSWLVSKLVNLPLIGPQLDPKRQTGSLSSPCFFRNCSGWQVELSALSLSPKIHIDFQSYLWGLYDCSVGKRDLLLRLMTHTVEENNLLLLAVF